MTTRRIGGSEESCPSSAWGRRTRSTSATRRRSAIALREVLRVFAAGGGTVIDTSPMYGRAESVLGDLIDELQLRPKFWLATKVWTRGRGGRAAQIETSMRRLRTSTLELVQIHNLLDWREHVPTLRNLKDERQDPLHGHHALSRRRARGRCCRCWAPSASTGCRSTTRSAEREAEIASAAVLRGARHRGARQPAVRGRRAVRHDARQAAAAVGRRDRLRVVGAVLPALRLLAPGRDVRDSGDRETART